VLRSYKRWPADNRPHDGFVLVAVHPPGDRATVQIVPFRKAQMPTSQSTDVEIDLAEALQTASVEASKQGLVVYVALQQGAQWDGSLGRLID